MRIDRIIIHVIYSGKDSCLPQCFSMYRVSGWGHVGQVHSWALNAPKEIVNYKREVE